MDHYTAELQRHGLDSAEREVRWLNELIETERSAAPPAAPAHLPCGTSRGAPADPAPGTRPAGTPPTPA